MAAITGKSGTFSYGGGSVARINDWSLDVETNMHDVTSFSTAGVQWREFVDGLSGWTGEASGFFDPTSTGINDLIVNTLTPTTAAVVFEIDQTNGGNFNGSVFVESASFGTPIDGEATVTFSFQGTGALSYSTST